MSIDPLSTGAPAIVHSDFKSPYAYLAVAPTREPERELDVESEEVVAGVLDRLGLDGTAFVAWAHAEGLVANERLQTDAFDEPQPQLLYALAEQHTGLGYATDAAALVLGYTFNNFGFDYLDSSMDAGHERSARVCERLGFRLHDEREEDGKLTRFYRTRASDWRGRQG